jgi:hypothetical protein
MKKLTRRKMLGSIGLAAGTSLVVNGDGEVRSQASVPKDASAAWQYVPLAPAVVAAEAYRLKPENGCMYGLFTAILTTWSKQSGQSCDSFPFHMMRYGEGGIGGWGTVCGALNGAAAIIGLFEKDRQRRMQLIGELFSWYERAELPIYAPLSDGSPKIAKTASASVLCHISVGRWCKASGAEMLGPQMKERCRRLTADVAVKTVELLNHNLGKPLAPVAVNKDVKAPKEPPKALGKMDCNTCHEPEKKKP